MPPKTWRTLSTKVATPFRKLSFSERSRSRSPSRQGSTDIPRSDSPVPGDLPRSRVASDAPAPVLDTITTKPPVDKDAVDLDSPTGSAKEPPIDTPPDPKPQEVVDLAPKEDKPVEVTAHEPPAEPNHVVYHAEPDELHHEHPAVEEQHSQVHQQAAPATKVETKVVQFSEAPEVPAADDGSEGSEVKLDDEFDLKNAPEPPSAGSDDSRDFNALMGDQNDVWADEGDGDVTISSPASRDDQVGTEIWLRTVQGQETFAPMTLWVDHLARTVAINPPWEQVTKGDGFDDSDEFDSTLRYWDFIESHPAHTGLPAGSSEEAMEALSWCYTDWLLNPLADPRRQPFSIEECRELLTLLKTLEGPLQTHIAAKIHVRLTKHRQALNRVLESEVVHNPTSTYKASKDPFGNLFVKIFVGLFCFGIPYKYVPKDDHRHLPSETDSLLQKAKSGPLLADSPIFAAALTLIAALLITSSVVFLALPDQENAAELSALVSLFFSAASLASSIINLERRSSDTVGDESSTHLHVKRQSHPFVRSLPLVFITWSIIALIAAIYLYVYGVEAFPGHHDGMVLNDILRWVIVAMGATLSFILLISAWVTRRRA
ncbi:hypothetical protein FRC01_000131 [Tulasnella sp. 417]|nr:hypothetical protein FRC01_000131 [Tulasnella sp. 417]